MESYYFIYEKLFEDLNIYSKETLTTLVSNTLDHFGVTQRLLITLVETNIEWTTNFIKYEKLLKSKQQELTGTLINTKDAEFTYIHQHPKNFSNRKFYLIRISF